MTWKSKRSSKWREFLTPEEAATIVKYDAVTEQIAKLRKKHLALFSLKNMIQNRAVHRAKYEATK